MRNLLNLVQNETLKVLRKKRFLVVLGILLVLIPLFAYGQFTTQQRLEAKIGLKDWRAQLLQQITETEHRIQSSSYLTDDRKKAMQMQIDQQKYYLDHNLNPATPGAPSFTRTFMQYGISMFLPLLVIVIASDIVSTEMTDGTIKLLLTRPVKRWKILLSKYITLLLFTSLTVLATGVFTYLISGLFFGYAGWGAPLFTGFTAVNGALDTSHVQVVPQWKLILMNYGLGWFAQIVVATLSFMISVLVRGTAAGMGVMLATLIGGNILVQLAADFPLAKYLFVTHLQLTDFVNGSTFPVPGVTLAYSLTVLLIWGIGGLIISFVTFTKKDVLA